MAQQFARGTPPTIPQAWVDHDADLATQLALRKPRGEPYEGGTACACAGTWRYRLVEHPRRPICRCLHCGGVLVEAAPGGPDGAA